MPETFITETLPDGAHFRMRHVPGGDFMMGAEDDDNEALERERPRHPVRISDFYIGEFAVTQSVWAAVMEGENPSGFKGTMRPVENVSWKMIDVQFLPRLNEITGKKYRLPTEAEWEYAARGGPHWRSENYLYAGSDLLDQVGWYKNNSDDQTRNVGMLLPNALGLYDMSGNVWEWCADWYDERYYQKWLEQGRMPDPVNLEKGGSRVVRGGGCFARPRHCRLAYRDRYMPDDFGNDLGFRLVLQSVG